MKKGTNDPNRYVELASTLYAPLQWKSNDILEVKKKIGNAESMENIWRERQQKKNCAFAARRVEFARLQFDSFQFQLLFFGLTFFWKKRNEIH